MAHITGMFSLHRVLQWWVGRLLGGPWSSFRTISQAQATEQCIGPHEEAKEPVMPKTPEASQMIDSGQLQVKHSQTGSFRQMLGAQSLQNSVSFPELSGSHPWSIPGVLLQVRACI